MNCPHGNEYEDHKDCPEYPCDAMTPAIAAAIIDRAGPFHRASTSPRVTRAPSSVAGSVRRCPS